MKSLLKFVLVCVFVVGMTVGDAFAQDHVPAELNVQGVLRNVAGEVVTGAYGMTFRLYDQPTGGTLLLTKTQTVSVVGGVFNVYLPAAPTVFINRSQVYLEIQIGTDVLPRRAMTSVGFAFQAEHAEQADELLGAATDLACSNPSGCVDLADLAVNYASSASKGGPADDLVCSGCVATSDIADLTITGAGNGTGTGDIAGSTIGTWNLYNGAVTTDKLANDAVDSNKLKDDVNGIESAVGTHHIQNNAVTAAKLAPGAVGNTQINFNYATSNSKGGPALNLACSTQCVSSGEVDFNYAVSDSKGGPATNVECPNFGGAGIGCVGTGDVGFNFAGSTSKGGAASNLACSKCVSNDELRDDIYYALGTSKGGAAVDVQCSGCVNQSDLSINYAGSASQGGPATGLSCTGCIGNSQLGVNYAGSSSKGGPASNLDCPGGCVDTADINNQQVTDVKIKGPISANKISLATASNVGVAKFGNGLSIDGNALVTVDWASAPPPAVLSQYFKKGTENLYINPGYQFVLNDGGDSDTAYFVNPTGASDDQIAVRLVLGDNWDQSERFEIYYSGPEHGDTVVHALYANGDAFHYGNLQFNGELTCKTGGCIDGTDIKDGEVYSAEIHDHTITGTDLATNLSFTTSGDITLDEVIANKFTDRGDTRYWADPASTSKLNNLRINNLYTSALGTGTSYGISGNNLFMDTINTGAAGDPLEIQYSRCADVRMFWGSCGNQTLDVNGYIQVKTLYDRDNTGYYINPASGSYVSVLTAQSGVNIEGQNPLKFSSYGGGWYMSDSNWVRAYNSKSVYSSVEIQAGAQMRAPIYYDLNNGSYYVDPAGYSHMGRAIYQDYPGTAAHNVIGDFAAIGLGNKKGIAQHQ
ncbi:MAG: hypothetical protein GXP54_08265, partial [Deltaproteobacteria bacterium]|nr:hypothetical protein [Deltaproteobacteria bacterium]